MSKPNREQFIEVIRNGDDSKDKNIVLCFDGCFDLVYDFDPENGVNYVGRSETLDAGNDYVGEDAVNDIDYIDSSYAMFLEAWIDYKKNGRSGRYLEDIRPASSERIAELEKTITNLP